MATEQHAKHIDVQLASTMDALQIQSEVPSPLKALALLLLASGHPAAGWQSTGYRGSSAHSSAAGWQITGQRGHGKLVANKAFADNDRPRSWVRMASSDSTSLPDQPEDNPKERFLDLFSPRLDPVLSDPISKAPLQSQLGLTGQVLSSSSSGLRFPQRSTDADAMYVDLVAQVPTELDNIDSQIADEIRNTFSAQTGMFRSPLLPFLYERGWRQNFRRAGFPGIDKEFTEVQQFFTPAIGGTVIDLSCGSGLMTRRLVSSGRYARVLALDFSEEMLKETSRRFRREKIPTEKLVLVRADAGALPLQTDSVDAIHAGAAMHCWPKLEQSLAEVKRALKPGGQFFATTFFKGAYTGGRNVNPLNQQGTGSMYFFQDEAELNDLLKQAGFSEFQVRREGSACAIIRAIA